MMAWDNRFMIDHVLHCSGTPLSIRQIIGAVRVVFAVTLTRRAVKRTCFETPEFKRAGPTEYCLDGHLRADRMVRELMAA
jgi:hypothetical protein